ncbi:MAG: insulinase family protein [Ignavibacteria bacterium]|nr:insulinase family protein [Ignavibacteria bacterium]MBT8383004.1 insulinase family protein [Ignavibacteria bacterium]NNL20961.1 insulinase family protein [Ignavibacteriaceae bacterium]
MDKYYLTTLPNGTRIISEYIPYVKSFSIGFWFNVGARDENARNNGISHFIEHMVFKGTKRRSAKMIAEEIESFGGYINAFTSKEHTCFYSKGLSHNIGKTFNVISDMIQNPLFRENHIKKEAGVVIDELKDLDDSPEELIYDKFEEIIFSGNTLSLPVIGREGNIKNFTSESLFRYHNTNYKTKNLLIVASGSVKHDELIKLTEKYISQNKSRFSRSRDQFKKKKAADVLFEKEIQQVHTIIGKTAPGYKDKKRNVVRFLSALLGEGSSSRLFLAVREKLGITYQINSFLNSYFDASAFGVYFSTNINQYDKVIEIVLREFKKLREKRVSERELKKVKEYLKGGLLLNLENTTNRMMRMANSMLYYNRIVSIEEYLKKIDRISSDDVLKIANESLNEAQLIKVILKSVKS